MIRRALFGLVTMALLAGGTDAQSGRSSADAAATSQTPSRPAPADAAAISEPGEPAESRLASSESASALVWEGVDLYMHDYGPNDGQLRDPTFWAHAERGRRAGTGKIWSLQNIRAVIYREDAENLVIEAADGQLDEEGETAKLTRRVRLTTGPLRVDLEELLWDNTKGLATSDRTVRVTTGETRLIASSIVIDPDEDTIVLRKGSGTIRLSEAKP